MITASQSRFRRAYLSTAKAANKSARRRLLLTSIVTLGGVAGSIGVLGASTVEAVSAATPAVDVNLVWTQSLPDQGSPIALSSPNVANLDGSPAVVVGDRAGKVYAFHLSNGSVVTGWPYNAGAPVDSTPSVAPLNAGGLDTVFVGTGNAASPTSGGYQAISPSGQEQWFTQESNPSTDPYPHNGVQASLSVGDLQGGTDVVGGSLGQNMYALNASNGTTLAGFPWYEADSDFSTAALADLYGNGQTEIIDGGDSSAGVSYGQTYTNGGHLRVLSATGNAGTPTPSGGLICQYNTDQNIAQSSPAVGTFLAGGSTGIVFGTGDYYSNAWTTGALIALDNHCNARWVKTLDGTTTSSPALADVLGNGQLQVVEGTNIGNGYTAGSVWVLDGSTGNTLWTKPAAGAVIGSIVTADLTGNGYQDLIVPTTNRVQIFDGRTGDVVASIGGGSAFQSAPLITQDANGTIGITAAGYFENGQGQLQGIVFHYEVTVNNSTVNEVGAWPMFHHDSQLTGDAGTAKVEVQVACNPPSTKPEGYVIAARDGGVFNYGNLPFCGSLGNLVLNKPVVGLTETQDGGGYWMVTSDGGIFAFGDAPFYGSEGGQPLNEPIVGMTATPDDKGYWLVASDGGIFAFGDARFFGSMGGQPLNQPIVGMTTTPDGRGYWMVASDGGIFAFGDAHFFGSEGAQHLNRPIVGIASDPATGGYWMVASDGGIFAFGAPFFGSMGGHPLNRPIVGMQATPDGNGYWFVASDGGIFNYGDAAFNGSEGGDVLNDPIGAITSI